MQVINPTSSFNIYANYNVGKSINLMSRIETSSAEQNSGEMVEGVLQEIILKKEVKKKNYNSVLRMLEWGYRVCFLMVLVIGISIVLPVIKNKFSDIKWLPGNKVEANSESNLDIGIVASPTPTPDPASLPFSIEITKIGVNDKVIPNVDAKNSTVYSEALKEGVAHGLNSGFPGQGEMIYIFGHSTDFEWNVATYNAIFYKIKDLEIGDEIILHHGSRDYFYQMYEQKIIAKDDTEFVNNMMNEDVLILQTCYPPGTSWQRLIVLAKPIRVEENGKSGFELVLGE